MNVVSVLVILYDKQPQDSLTLFSLLKQQQSITHLYIWNNGPTVVIEDFMVEKLKQKINEVILINEPNNYPLSKIYNWFFDRCNSDYFILLDDDSILDASYLELINHINENDFNADLVLPRINQNNEVHAPKENNKVVLSDACLNHKHCMSIGSGIIINKHLINIFQLHFKNVFDERFALYGVDTTFFYRLSKLDENVNVKCWGDISHSLSRLDPKEKENFFRFKERTFDLILTARNYPTFGLLKSTIKRFLVILIKYRNMKLFIISLKCFILGSHPRCRMNFVKNDDQ